MKGFIPTGVHSFLDYVLGTITAASPWIFGFGHAGSAALFIPLFIGVQQLNMAVFTKYRFGIWKYFPLQLHLIFDFTCGFILFAAAFIYPYTGQVFWSQIVFGLLNMGLGIFTIPSPFLANKLDVFDPRGC